MPAWSAKPSTGMTKNDDPYPGCQRHSAILRFTRKSDFERVRRVRDLLYTAKEPSSFCSVAVSWGEIVTVVCQRHDLLGAREILGNLSWIDTLVPVGSFIFSRSEFDPCSSELEEGNHLLGRPVYAVHDLD